MARKKTSNAQMRRLARIGGVVLGVGALAWFAVEGGEFGTRALFDQHERRERLAAEVAQLRHEIDSLQKEKDAVLKDNATLERIAREQYGMVRGNKELLFWVGGSRSRDDSTSVAVDSLPSRNEPE